MNPLKNPEAEQCAQDIAACITDRIKRQEIFAAFHAANPDLKKWEGQAIGSRAVWLARQESERLAALGLSVENYMVNNHANAI